MKSIQIKRYGNSDVMEVNNAGSITTPPPAGKILVEIKAAGVNPVDWKIREGYFQQMIPLQFPSTLGMDFSGVIKHIGESVPSDFKQGDEVYGQASVLRGGSGAFAELALDLMDYIFFKFYPEKKRYQLDGKKTSTQIFSIARSKENLSMYNYDPQATINLC